MTEQITIIHDGTPEARNLVDPVMCAKGLNPKTYVWVGRFKSQHENGGGGLGAQAMGQLITATLHGYPDVFRRFLPPSATRYEPETKNKIGGYGAYRELPPTPETVEATIAEAVAYLAQQIAAGVDPWAYLYERA